MTTRRPTQHDIALLAGVSRTTVSLVLNGVDVRLRPEVRRSVLSAAARVGYTVNPVARNLAGGRNRLVGVYTFERLFPIAHRDFYYPFLLGIEEECEAQAQDLVLFTSAADPSGRRAIEHGGVNRLRLADGCVLLGLHVDVEELRRLASDRMPFVFIGRRDLPDVPISYVGADYAAATAELVDRLHSLGHRRIGYFGIHDAPAGAPTERFDAYRAALRRLRLRSVSARRLPPEQIDADLVAAMIGGGVTAVLAETPQLAARIRAVAAERGRRVPADFSIAVLGDYERSDDIDWTTYHIPRREMGRQSIRTLLELLAGDDAPRRLVLSCPIVAGTTIGPG